MSIPVAVKLHLPAQLPHSCHQNSRTAGWPHTITEYFLRNVELARKGNLQLKVLAHILWLTLSEVSAPRCRQEAHTSHMAVHYLAQVGIWSLFSCSSKDLWENRIRFLRKAEPHHLPAVLTPPWLKLPQKAGRSYGHTFHCSSKRQLCARSESKSQ